MQPPKITSVRPKEVLNGRRVSKSNGKLYWYGSGGEIPAETDGTGATTAEYVFFGGQRIAIRPAGGNPIFYVEDMLGTSRVTTTSAGVVCYDADYYPYGGERSYTNTCPQNYKFEGKERDAETGNDDFGARYYSNRFGRWLSADWSAVPYANLLNPQTLNLYSMVGDDPESFADLDGHEDRVVEKSTCGGTGQPACRRDPSTTPDQTKRAAAAQNTVDQQQGQGATQGTSTTPAATAPTKQFISINSAGIAGEKTYNPASKSENLEFNGNIYKDSQGHCCFLQTPAKGTADSSSPPDVSTLPGGATRVATYHTHAAYDARYDNEHFSPADQTNAGRRGVPIFVGTPGGVIRKYDPATGRITTFHSTTD